MDRSTLAAEIESRTAGNPLFAVQLVGDWVQRGVLVAGPGGFELQEGEDAALPDDLHATWSTRVRGILGRLPAHDRRAA